MTLPAGTNFGNGGDKPGTGLSPVEENAGVETFLAAMSAPEVPQPRSWRMRLFDYSAHAAMIVGLVGFAWTVSDHVVHRPAAPTNGAVTSGDAAVAPRPVALVTPMAPKPEYASPDAAGSAQIQTGRDTASVDQRKLDQAKLDRHKPDHAEAEIKPAQVDPEEVAELRRANARMAEDIKTLRADLASLNKTVRADQSREQQIRSLSLGVDGVNNGLAAVKSETNVTLAQLSGRIDKMQHEARTSSIDAGATGSLPSKPVAEGKDAPLPPTKPASARLASLEEEHRQAPDAPAQKPAAIAGWSVLDVYDGVALVEGRRGAIEVVPGGTIPGAGVVRSIDRSGNGWTVTTTKGVIAFGPPGRYARHASSRELLHPYRYDF